MQLLRVSRLLIVCCALIGACTGNYVGTYSGEPRSSNTHDIESKQNQDGREQEIGRLVERLGSDDYKEREEATQRLKGFRNKAKDALLIASKSKDPEVALRANFLLEILRIRESLTPHLTSRHPELPEALAGGNKSDWTAAFLLILQEYTTANQDLKPLYKKDLQSMAEASLVAAEGSSTKSQVLDAILDWQLEIGPSVYSELSFHPSVAVRKRTALALGEAGHKESVPLLIALLNDESNDVRKCALRALATMEAKEAAPHISDMLTDLDSDIRFEAVRALSRISGREANRRIRPLLFDQAPKVRMQTALATAQIGETKFVTDLAKLLQDEHSNVRAAAVISLGRLKAREYAEQISSMLAAEAAHVRYAAVQAITIIEERAATAKLLTVLKDQDASVRRAAANSLLFLALNEPLPNEAVGSIISCLRSNPLDPALFSLVLFGGRESAIRHLSPLLKDPEPSINATAALALGLLVAKDTSKEIAELLRSESEVSRAAAVEALGQMHATEIAGDILPMLEDRSATVRAKAARTLGRFGENSSVAGLRNCLKDANPSVRKHSAGALGRILDRGSIPSIVSMLSDPAIDVRIFAAAALCRMGDARGMPILINSMTDPRTSTPGEMISLNRIYCEHGWERLIRTGAKETRYFNEREAFIKAIALEAKVELEIKPEVPAAWRHSPIHLVVTKGQPIMNALEAAIENSGCSVIVDTGKLTICSIPEAAEFWFRWERERNSDREGDRQKD